MQSKEKLSLKGCSICDKPNHIWFVLLIRIEQRVFGDTSIICLGMKVIDSREIHKRQILRTFDDSICQTGLNCHTSKVAHSSANTSNTGEKTGLTSVGIPYECNCGFHRCKVASLFLSDNPLLRPIFILDVARIWGFLETAQSRMFSKSRNEPSSLWVPSKLFPNVSLVR